MKEKCENLRVLQRLLLIGLAIAPAAGMGLMSCIKKQPQSAIRSDAGSDYLEAERNAFESLRANLMPHPSKLFSQSEILMGVKIKLPFYQMSKAKNDIDEFELKEKEFPGSLVLTQSSGESKEFNLKAQFKGAGRFSGCLIGNLKLNLKKSEIVGTIFEGAEEFNMTSPCIPRASDEDPLVNHQKNQEFLKANEDISRKIKATQALEYIAYRIVESQLTVHLKTRLAVASLEDISTGGKTLPTETGPIFFVEKPSELAKRFGLSKDLIMDRMSLHDDKNIDHRTYLKIFQDELAALVVAESLVGNQDWSFGGIGAAESSFSPVGSANTSVLVFSDVLSMPFAFDFDSASGGMGKPFIFQSLEVEPKAGIKELLSFSPNGGKTINSFLSKIPKNSWREALERLKRLPEVLKKEIDVVSTILDAGTVAWLNSYQDLVKQLPSAMEKEIASKGGNPNLHGRICKDVTSTQKCFDEGKLGRCWVKCDSAFR